MKHKLAVVLVAAATLLSGASAIAGQVKFRSPEDALRQGMSAFNGGFYEIAVPALEHAAQSNMFLGQYFLARIYADNGATFTDHPKAYLLYQHIANEHADIDPDDDRRAPYVAHAMTAVARYRLSGLPEFGVTQDPQSAAELLHHSATVFGDEDAQFELAKLKLKGEGVDADIEYGRHWLSVLSQKGHAPAQAFLAQLLHHGKVMEKNTVHALALITVAVENAPARDRVWIEDIYQDIYCGAGQGIRKQATGMVADWRDRYGRKPEVRRDRIGLGVLSVHAERSCSNGEPVMVGPGVIEAGAGAPAAIPQAMPEPREFMKGSSAAGLRDVGTVETERTR